ncbi:hypothetical protein PVAP13_9KG283913 [Panicum virgatum]|uniref:Uncharacterized protein n=1 Tax=Panicum virgatum TaxID=38727 RepID=A0A8T0NMC2_PANVG|nr:hypothetical protein PVAP13_9KG283913 [Panicum virgatum]KAG2550008.1 hypothetical protein PVAP13_9KG283913 [Panicum virgatum]
MVSWQSIRYVLFLWWVAFRMHVTFAFKLSSNMETLKAATVADGEAPRSSAQAVSSELDL